MIHRPQRLPNIAPPGALLKRASVPPSRTAKAKPNKETDHLALVRQLPCLRCGVEPCGSAAHLRMCSALHGKTQAMQRKPSAKWTTPLCAGCHLNDSDSQHRVGEEVFWARVGTNPFLFCEQLWPKTGDPVAMRAVVIRTISERTKP